MSAHTLLFPMLWDGVTSTKKAGAISSAFSDARFVRTLFGLAERSKLIGVLVPRLMRYGDAQLAAEARALGTENKRTVMLNNSGVLMTILELDAALRETGIRYAVMKGPTQQIALYGDPFVRASGDVDLLVAPRDFAGAVVVIARLGFERMPPDSALWWTRFLGERHLVREERSVRGGRLRANVDVHHRLQQPGSPQPRASGDFLRRAGTQILCGVTIPVLCAADIPLLSAMSLVKALFNREPAGSHAFDLLTALKGGEAETVDAFVRHARSESLEGTAWVALRLLAALCPDVPIPVAAPSVLAGLTREALCAMVLQPDAVPSWPQRRYILREACLRDPLRTAREYAWLGLSEAARWAGERRARARSAPSNHLEQAT